MKFLPNCPLQGRTLSHACLYHLNSRSSQQQPPYHLCLAFLVIPRGTLWPGGSRFDFGSLTFVSTAICSAFCGAGGNPPQITAGRLFCLCTCLVMEKGSESSVTLSAFAVSAEGYQGTESHCHLQ